MRRVLQGGPAPFGRGRAGPTAPLDGGDRIAVEELLGTSVPYVGLMGPREWFEEMLDDFEEEGRSFSEGDLRRLYTPVGLDLGGGSPYRIALSIVGEVLAVSNDREPRHLRERDGPIHDRVEVAPDT